MKLPKIIYTDKLIGGKYTGMSLVFWIIIFNGKFRWETDLGQEKRVKKTIRHEQIHYFQWLELWFIGFPFVYFFYYLRNRFKKMKHSEAYRKNPMEIEAYSHDWDEEYLENREKFSWTKYI